MNQQFCFSLKSLFIVTSHIIWDILKYITSGHWHIFWFSYQLPPSILFRLLIGIIRLRLTLERIKNCLHIYIWGTFLALHQCCLTPVKSTFWTPCISRILLRISFSKILDVEQLLDAILITPLTSEGLYKLDKVKMV